MCSIRTLGEKDSPATEPKFSYANSSLIIQRSPAVHRADPFASATQAYELDIGLRGLMAIIKGAHLLRLTQKTS